MKKIIIVLFYFMTLTVAAQESHLDFMGIPIDGNINTFVQKLEKKGLIKSKANDKAVILEGTFAGKNAKVFALNTLKSKTVWKVVVYLDKSSSWYSLKSSYEEYKRLFTQKYGLPSDHFEFFSKPYYEGDGYELQALKNDKCTYSSYFETVHGIISVSIGSFGEICLAYQDKKNANEMTKEKNESALDDI